MPADGVQAGPPVVLGRQQAGEPIRTGWEAVQPPAGSDGGHYTHTQIEPQSVVTIEHNLGFRPQVSLFSLDFDTKYRAFGVQHLDTSRLRISMDKPTPVVAVLS